MPHPDVLAADGQHQRGGAGGDGQARQSGFVERVGEVLHHEVVAARHPEPGVADQQSGLPDRFGEQHRVVVAVPGQPVEAVQPGPLGAEQEVVRAGGLPAGEEHLGHRGAVHQVPGDGPVVEVVAGRGAVVEVEAATAARAGAGVRAVRVRLYDRWHDGPPLQGVGRSGRHGRPSKTYIPPGLCFATGGARAAFSGPITLPAPWAGGIPVEGVPDHRWGSVPAGRRGRSRR